MDCGFCTSRHRNANLERCQTLAGWLGDLPAEALPNKAADRLPDCDGPQAAIFLRESNQ